MLQVDTTSTFPQVLLRLRLAGTEYLFSERGPETIQTDDGPRTFEGGLAVGDPGFTVDLFGTTASSRSVSVAVYIPAAIDLAYLASLGIELYAAEADLYWWSGNTFEAAQRIAGGRIKDPIFGDPADPLLLSFVVERDFTERALYPGSGGYCRDDSFASLSFGTADDNDLGRFYPVPIGKPGTTSRSLAGVIKTMPAVRANIWTTLPDTYSRLVVALGPILATTCRAWSSNNYWDDVDLTTATDDYGNIVTYIDLSTASSTTAHELGDADTGPTYVAFTEETTPGPSGEGMRGLGDVVVWALGLSSLSRTGDVDWARLLGAQDRLNQLGRIDTYLAERVKPLDWLLNDVLAYFPVFVTDAGDGIYVDVWDYRSDSRAEAYIDTSQGGCERVAPISWTSRSNANVITVRGHLASSGALFTTQTWSGDPTDADATAPVLISPAVTTRRHPLLSRSFTRFGRNELDVQVPTVQDPDTLDKIAEYLVHREALPTAEVGYILPWRRFSPRLGMRVAVTDDGLGLTEAPGVLTGYKYVQNTLQVRVVLLA